MVNKLAIDWDSNELRIVAAQCSGRNVKVTDASVIPVTDGDVNAVLRRVVAERGLANTETLVAIGRGKAELRELQLPPVPDDELPDMVRFQAIRSFATAGENAVVDFLVTKRNENGIEIIAAAVGPTKLASIRETCEAVDLPMKRIALRPLAAAALYLINRPVVSEGDTVLIDLLADDAEIVVAREGKVIFVRTVRMPGVEAARGRALAGELKRSLMACGSSGSIGRVILWGREEVHSDEKEMLAEASGSQVEVISPFDLVDVDRNAKLPEHVGRLAPLVGLLAADDSDGDRLIDFLNPRERYIETPSPYRRALLIGIPIAAALLLAFGVYRRIKGLDRQIADLRSANAAMKPDVERAAESINRTETVDDFLDGDVNWLNEIRRVATEMPPSDQMIVRSVSVTSDSRAGGGTLKIGGGAIDPSVIDVFEQALRNETHQVKGNGASEQKVEDAYRWGFTESITIQSDAVRNERYAGILNAADTDGQKTPQVETLEEANAKEANVPKETNGKDTNVSREETPPTDRANEQTVQAADQDMPASPASHGDADGDSASKAESASKADSGDDVNEQPTAAAAESSPEVQP